MTTGIKADWPHPRSGGKEHAHGEVEQQPRKTPKEAAAVDWFGIPSLVACGFHRSRLFPNSCLGVRKWPDLVAGRGYSLAMRIDDDTCFRALTVRDPRFDGLFFVGVTTTKIYCRPICTAKPARRDRCRFYSNSARAEQDGFRPCLRCRPELAPGDAPVDAVQRTARIAARRIEAGALNDGGSLEALARSLGLSTRQLRRVVAASSASPRSSLPRRSACCWPSSY